MDDILNDEYENYEEITVKELINCIIIKPNMINNNYIKMRLLSYFN